MPSKPADYFLGLHDFFALLIPGALLTAWLSPVAVSKFSFVARTPTATTPMAGWIAFLLASYFMGQLVFSVASRLDRLVDPIANRRLYSDPSTDKLRNRIGIPVGKLHNVGTAWLRVNSPAGLADIDRLAALSKFYRSLVVVFAAFLICGYPAQYLPQLIWAPAWRSGLWIAAAALLSTISFAAYAFYRVRHWKTVLMYLQLACQAEPAAQSVDAESGLAHSTAGKRNPDA